MTFYMDILVSVGCILITLKLSEYLRQWTLAKWTKENLLRIILLEFVATFELIAVAFECSVVFGIGGLAFFGPILCSIWYWRLQNWQNVSTSPCTYIEDLVMRKIGILTAVVAILAQLAGGFASYSYFTKRYWSLGLTTAHAAQIHEGFHECQAHISVLPILATAVEAFGLFLYIISTNAVSRTRSLTSVATLINAMIGTSLVILAMEYTGGYYSPVLASVMQFGCSGATLFEHLQVYWIGPTVGALAANYVESNIIRISGKQKSPAVASKKTKKGN